MNATSYPIADPVFILALPRSFSALIGTMLGQHPQMYGLPETHLFGCATVSEWWDMSSKESFNMSHGLVRAVAQLYFGGQDEDTVVQARAWLRRRLDFTTGYLLEMLAEKASPRILVDRSPSIVYSQTSMDRAHLMFPLARFIHLVQHPRGYADSVMNGIRESARNGPVPQWMLDLASYPGATLNPVDVAGHDKDLDPQRGWYTLNTNICRFLDSIPDSQKICVRGEDLLGDPDPALGHIADWIGVRSDAEVIEEMKHPERSPYACLGPPSARYGNDYDFLAHPTFTPASNSPEALGGELGWGRDGTEFSTEVRALVQRFGYV